MQQGLIPACMQQALQNRIHYFVEMAVRNYSVMLAKFIIAAPRQYNDHDMSIQIVLMPLSCVRDMQRQLTVDTGRDCGEYEDE